MTAALAHVAIMLPVAVAVSATAHADPRRLCGWFDNPTPANVSLYDGRREWVVSVQGGRSADGEWPSFKPAQRVRHGIGGYGYGCACLTVDTADGAISRIIEARAEPLAFCRRNQKLRHAERKLR